jgi:AraC-like DNA-binding protein
MRLPPEILAAARKGLAIVYRKHKREQQHYGPDRTRVDEVLVILGGAVECLVDGNWVTAQAGEIVCIGRNRLWGVRPCPARRGAVRLMYFAFAADATWRDGLPTAPIPLSEPWWRRLLQIEADADFDERSQRVVALADILAFARDLAHVLRGSRPLPAGPARVDTASDWMRTWMAAQDLIRTSAIETLTVAGLARSVHCSMTQLARIFRTVRGTTPKAAIAQRRITEAKRLLRSGKCSVTQVAAKVGFASAQSFHAAFVHAVGVAPGAFAKRKE